MKLHKNDMVLSKEGGYWAQMGQIMAVEEENFLFFKRKKYAVLWVDGCTGWYYGHYLQFLRKGEKRF